jgi:elongation factor Ts
MSIPVTAAMVKDLRERTGVGMSKCKEALDEAKGDMELAIANLRKSGMATAVKKEGRETKEGMIGFAKVGSNIAVVEVNSETDFVAKNDRFKEFLDNIAHEIAATHPASLDLFMQQKYSKDPSLTMDQFRATMIQAIGENIQIRRFKLFHLDNNHSVGVYSHMNGKVVTAVEITNGGDEEALAKEIAMHVAAASPDYLSPETVPQDVLANEKDIAKSQMLGKPANMMDKIVEGKMNAFYDTNCLVRQKFIKDDTLTITQFVDKRGKEIGKPLVVSNFLRWGVGQ